MKFEDMPLHVPSLKKINAKISSFIDGLNNATCKEDAIKVVTKSFKYDDELSTDFSIISVRNSLNTADPVYEKAQEVCDEVLPAAGQIMNEFNKAYVYSKYRKDL